MRWWLVLALLLPALPAAANGPGARPTSPFWQTVTRPGYLRSRELVEQGIARLRQAMIARRNRDRIPPIYQRQRDAEIHTYLERALARFELARALVDDDPEILFWLATTRIDLQAFTPVRQRRQLETEARDLLLRVRSLDGSYEAERVALELGIVHTRHRNFDAAIAEYHTAITHAFRPNSTAHANLAEVTMLSGNLEDAITHYRRAIEISSHPLSYQPESQLLAMWGLAVAQDRLGEHLAAIETAALAAQNGRSTPPYEAMAVLRRDGVFFEPSYEIHYYEALGHEAMAREAPEANHLPRALASWKLFLAEQERSPSPWADLAREHAERIEKELADRNEPPPARRRRRR